MYILYNVNLIELLDKHLILKSEERIGWSMVNGQ